jgi:hypothetical protein
MLGVEPKIGSYKDPVMTSSLRSSGAIDVGIEPTG